LRQLRHPKIGKIFDLVNHSIASAVVLELCDGSLQDFIEEIGLRPDSRVTKSSPYSLRFENPSNTFIKKGVVHRDIRTADILLKNEGGRKKRKYETLKEKGVCLR
jgi:serine/threonine protein kinase